MKFFSRLIPAMEENNVCVCIENSTRANMGDRYYFYTGQDMADFIEYANHPLFGACRDTGHGNAEGAQYGEITALGKHLKTVHINDNNGKADEHIIPFFGSVNMDEIMTALTDISFDGCFTFESGSTLLFSKNYFSNRREFSENTRLKEPPLFMQQHPEKLIYELGEYILKSYNCYEK